MSMIPGGPMFNRKPMWTILYPPLCRDYLILDEAGEAGDDEDDGRDQDVKVGVKRGGG